MHEDLMDQVVAEPNLARARAAVKRNRGAAGIDRMTVDELEVHWQRHGAKMRAKLVAGRWTPSPVRRVDIPKPNGGTRRLGIPTVMDRVVQQALLQVLQPIFDPRFSESSYGFRPRRSAHDAVRAAQGYVREGKDWVVDIDIAQFFDHVNHDILMQRIAEVIRDKRVLRLRSWLHQNVDPEADAAGRRPAPRGAKEKAGQEVLLPGWNLLSVGPISRDPR